MSDLKEDLEAAYEELDAVHDQIDRLARLIGWTAKSDILTTLGLDAKLSSVIDRLEVVGYTRHVD